MVVNTGRTENDTPTPSINRSESLIDYFGVLMYADGVKFLWGKVRVGTFSKQVFEFGRIKLNSNLPQDNYRKLYYDFS